METAERIFGSFAVLLLLGCGTSSSLPVVDSVDSERSAPVLAPSDEGRAVEAQAPTATSWIQKRVDHGAPIYSVDSGVCIEWLPRRIQSEPFKAVLVHTAQQFSYHTFVKKVVFKIDRYGVQVLSIAMKHWRKRLEEKKWKLISELYSQEFMPRPPKLVLDGLAVSVFSNWWWFDSYEKCREDLHSASPHTMRTAVPFAEDDDSWPLSVSADGPASEQPLGTK